MELSEDIEELKRMQQSKRRQQEALQQIERKDKEYEELTLRYQQENEQMDQEYDALYGHENEDEAKKEVERLGNASLVTSPIDKLFGVKRPEYAGKLSTCPFRQRTIRRNVPITDASPMVRMHQILIM